MLAGGSIYIVDDFNTRTTKEEVRACKGTRVLMS